MWNLSDFFFFQHSTLIQYLLYYIHYLLLRTRAWLSFEAYVRISIRMEKRVHPYVDWTVEAAICQHALIGM
jgi:hypothetical protein